jgi:hypothetical protein
VYNDTQIEPEGTHAHQMYKLIPVYKERFRLSLGNEQMSEIFIQKTEVSGNLGFEKNTAQGLFHMG